MSGIIWHILTYSAVGIFVIIAAYRTLKVIRLPIHLRWELAPIPHEKGKNRYGGSYLEEYEWWTKPRSKTHIASIIYMAKEIFLLKGVWKNNRGLWPFSFSLHMGIYLIIGVLFLQFLNALLIIFESLQALVIYITIIAFFFAAAGYLLGTFGSISLIFKRLLDSNLRPFSTFSKYLNLIFLCAIFTTGGYAWLSSGNFTAEIGIFIKDILTINIYMKTTFPLTLHIVLLLLFLIYLPFTDMIHFIIKYFTYHDIRWNDTPQNETMEKKLKELLSQPVTWSAAHIKADGRKNWVDIVTAENSDEKES